MTSEELITTAGQHMQNGDFKQAAKLYDYYLKNFGTHPEVYAFLGSAHFFSGSKSLGFACLYYGIHLMASTYNGQLNPSKYDLFHGDFMENYGRNIFTLGAFSLFQHQCHLKKYNFDVTQSLEQFKHSAMGKPVRLQEAFSEEVFKLGMDHFKNDILWDRMNLKPAGEVGEIFSAYCKKVIHLDNSVKKAG